MSSESESDIEQRSGAQEDERVAKDRAWHEWMMVGVGLTGLLAILAVIVSVAALSSGGTRTTTVMQAAPATGAGTAMPMSSRSRSGTAMGTMGTSGQSTSGASSSGKTENVKLVMKSDSEQAVKGPDGKYHDAVIPANFSIHAGDMVTVTVYNYDDMPHTWTAPMFNANAIVPSGSEDAPSKTTFTFTAPSKPGQYQWWCAVPCDPYSMTHNGLMRGVVTVTA